MNGRKLSWLETSDLQDFQDAYVPGNQEAQERVRSWPTDWWMHMLTLNLEARGDASLPVVTHL